MYKKAILFFLFFGLGIVYQLQAQNNQPPTTTRILFLMDASGSMMAKWQKNNRISIAKNLLSDIVDSLNNKANIEVALRVYGHQSSRADKDCKDTKLEVKFAKNNAEKVKERLKTIVPKGSTPIAYSLEQAAKDFPDDPYSRNIIILITDGKEGCDGDPCAVSLALQKQHVILKPFVIGMGLSPSIKDAFDCVGTFYDAAEEESFKEVLNVVVAQALSTTTAQVNLNNKSGKPLETNVPITFYDANIGIERYNFIHTFNSSGVPDTMLIDPINIYEIEVHTNPKIYKKNVKLKAGKHNTINISAPQGNLAFAISGISGYKDLKACVRKAGTYETVCLQQINSNQKYLIGKYDIEIPTLPVTQIKNIQIKQGAQKTIKIPQPGKVSFVAPTVGYGAIFITKNNKLVKIYDLNPDQYNQSVSIQPGTYKVIFRTKRSTNTVMSIEKTFTVRSGEFTSIKLTR